MNTQIQTQSIDSLNEEFCKEVGIKKIAGILINCDTDEIRYYSSVSSLKKIPAGWKSCKAIKFEKPLYPDLINNCNNFCALLNIKWDMFKELNNQPYIKLKEECFQATYIRTQLMAIKMSKSFGGGEMLNNYINAIKSTMFEFEFELLEEDYSLC